MVEPSGPNPLCATKVTCKFSVSISRTCPLPYGVESVRVLSSRIFRFPPFHCTNGQFTTSPDAVTVISLLACASRISVCDFNSRGTTPSFHYTMLTAHIGL